MVKNDMIERESKAFIKVYQVNAGDCVQVNYKGQDNKYHNIIIDCGYSMTFNKTLGKEIGLLTTRDEYIDLCILTHTDQDHIGGIKKLIKSNEKLKVVNKFWFNGGRFLINNSDTKKVSVDQGFELDKYIMNTGKGNTEKVVFGNNYNINGAKISILGPFNNVLDEFLKLWEEYDYTDINSEKITTSECDWHIAIGDIDLNKYKSDERIENRVSIAFIMEVCNKKILFLGDSFAFDVEKSLRLLGYNENNRLVVDYVKISHHGSKGNTSDGMLSLINCENFIISTNGTNRDYFPHKETFARILRHNLRESDKKIKFIFNYSTDEIKNIFNKDEFKDYNFECIYPQEGDNNVTIFL